MLAGGCALDRIPSHGRQWIKWPGPVFTTRASAPIFHGMKADYTHADALRDFEAGNVAGLQEGAAARAVGAAGPAAGDLAAATLAALDAATAWTPEAGPFPAAVLQAAREARQKRATRLRAERRLGMYPIFKPPDPTSESRNPVLDAAGFIPDTQGLEYAPGEKDAIDEPPEILLAFAKDNRAEYELVTAVYPYRRVTVERYAQQCRPAPRYSDTDREQFADKVRDAQAILTAFAGIYAWQHPGVYEAHPEPGAPAQAAPPGELGEEFTVTTADGRRLTLQRVEFPKGFRPLTSLDLETAAGKKRLQRLAARLAPVWHWVLRQAGAYMHRVESHRRESARTPKQQAHYEAMRRPRNEVLNDLDKARELERRLTARSRYSNRLRDLRERIARLEKELTELGGPK